MHMVSRRSFIAIASASAMLATGCSNSDGQQGSQTATSEPEEPKQLELIDYGFSKPDESGYVWWWAVGRNPNDSYIVAEPCFIATARDADGNVIDTDEFPTYLNSRLAVYPGAEFAFSSVLANCTESTAISVEAGASDEDNLIEIDGDAPSYEISSTTVNTNDMGWMTAAGEVQNGGDETCKIMVCAILKDSSGSIVNGGFTWAEDVPSGEKKPFSIDLNAIGTEYDTADFYAVPDIM